MLRILPYIIQQIEKYFKKMGTYKKIKVTIHETATYIRKSSQQAVCRFCEALSFAHLGGGFCFTGSLHQ
jgi:predicted metallopeptidase